MTKFSKSRGLLAFLAAGAAALALSGCSSAGAEPAATDADSAQSDAVEVEGADSPSAAEVVQIVDNHGTWEVATPPSAVMVTDNRMFQTLSDWGVEVVAMPRDLAPGDSPYKDDETIVNLGNHREPDLEAVVAVQPDLILNGQRFQSYYEDFATLAPDATIIELDPREGEAFDEELRRQTEALGKIFHKEAEAKELIAQFDESIERVKAAYQPEDTVMAVITSGGNINYAAPGEGRTLGPVFEILDLTPALEASGSTDHQGDDISVEAIADSNPDIILVMDRDAGVGTSSDDEGYVPANELLAGSAALQNVTAVQNDLIVYMPQYTYVNEGIQTYTTFFNTLADALEEVNN